VSDDTKQKFVGHFTHDDGSHTPMTSEQAEALWQDIEKRLAERRERLPDEKVAIRAMFDAYDRLRELGWREAIYCPKDGTHFQVIENNSTGIFDCAYFGEWPDGHWITFDAHDAYPSSKPPALFRLYPEDQKKEDALKAARKAAYDKGET